MITVLPHPGDAYLAAAGRIAEAMAAAVARRGEASLVAAGGTSFLPVYELLAARYAAAVDWPMVRVYVGDERSVPEESELHNGSVIRRHLIGRFPVGSRPRFMPVITGIGAEAAAHAYRLILPDRFDMVLLGLGRDGHSASLFAGSRERWYDGEVVVVPGELPPVVGRISMTVPRLGAADSLLGLAVGEAKAEIVRSLANDAAGTYPMPLAARTAGRAELLVDAAAGSLLA